VHETVVGLRSACMLLGFISVLAFLAVAALPAGLAALVLLWFARRRLSPPVAKIFAATAFTIGPAYALWRMEWFDVWRHGTPSLAFMVQAYGPYLAFFAAAGWLAGGRLSTFQWPLRPWRTRSANTTGGRNG
jgi:hypothetical protein